MSTNPETTTTTTTTTKENQKQQNTAPNPSAAKRPDMPNLDDNKITRDELRSILKAMDQDGFDKIMEDYIKEISDPNNITETNQYLRECMERKDLPANVKLVQPNAGFVIKSSKFNTKKPGIRQKVFINLVGLADVAPPQIDQKTNMCSLPHLLNRQRNDQDNKGKICYTFDVAFNPEAIRKGEENLAFKKFICDTAINGINNNILKSSNEKISNDYVLKTKINYKGKEISLMNINTIAQKEQFKNQLEPNENYKTQIQKEIDELKNKASEGGKVDAEENEDEKVFDKPDIDYALSQKEVAESNKKETNEKNATPLFKLKYSDDVQLHKYFYSPNNFKGEAQYSKLIVEISVPKVDNLTFAEVELDEKKLHFKFKDVYLLDLDLPVSVDKNTSEAKFDRKRSLLSISALIVRKNQQELKLKEDENIEIVNSEDEKEKENEIQKEKEKQEEIINNKIEENNKVHEAAEKNIVSESKAEVSEKKISEEKEKDLMQTGNVEGDDKKTLEKLEFDKKIKAPIDLELSGNKEAKQNEVLKAGAENKKEVKELVKEIKSVYNDEDDIEAGVAFAANKNADKDGFVDRTGEAEKSEESANNENNLPAKKTFEKKEMVQLAFLNFNCTWIYELD